MAEAGQSGWYPPPAPPRLAAGPELPARESGRPGVLRRTAMPARGVRLEPGGEEAAVVERDVIRARRGHGIAPTIAAALLALTGATGCAETPKRRSVRELYDQVVKPHVKP